VNQRELERGRRKGKKPLLDEKIAVIHLAHQKDFPGLTRVGEERIRAKITQQKKVVKGKI